MEKPPIVCVAEWDIGVPLFELDDASGVSDLLIEKYHLPDRQIT